MAETVLADLLDYTRDGEWGEGEPREGYVRMQVIRGTDFERVRFGDLSTLPVRYIRRDIAERKALQMGDVLIETAGGTKDQPTGRTVLIDDAVIRCASDPLIPASFARFLRPKSGAVDPAYLFWKLQAEYQSGAIFPYHIQHTGVARFQYTQFATSHPLDLPADPLVQRRIGETLSSFDDKIELNRRMNETLEAMAQAIFRDWFVDFGPVRRKQAGETDPVAIMGGLTPDPVRAAELAALFPDALGEDDLPVGWCYGELSELVINSVERCSPGFETESRPYVPIDTIAARTLIVHETRPGVEAQSSLVTFREDDILFGAMRPYFHKVALANFEGTTRTTVFVLRPRSRDDLAFALMIVNAKSTIDFATAHSSGTTIPYAVWRNTMEVMPVISPTGPIRAAFGQFVAPMLERMKASAAENRTLAETRDYLLPRLMSGEVRVGDLELESAA